MKRKQYQVCNFCIMDTSDKEIKFDQDGICNHCKNYFIKIKKNIIPDNLKEDKLKQLLKSIKKSGKNKKYDCVIGVSGGVDSSYVVLLAKDLGLRALLVHMDNGWNSEISVQNIKKLSKNTGFDLYTYVLNWNEFRDIQISLFKASIVDIELATDHAIKAVLYKISMKFNIKFLLDGGNIQTECIMPSSWRHTKEDRSNLVNIHKKFGQVKLNTFPLAGVIKRQFYKSIFGIKFIPFLNYFKFNRLKVIQRLKQELDWFEYGGKHHESVFTRFYQGYILPKKFKIDKRRSHLSNLICSGSITREEALLEISKTPYNEEKMNKDKIFVLKKLGFDEKFFSNYLELPEISHQNYKNDVKLINILFNIKYFFFQKKNNL